jgi:hypothetical protein
MEQNYMLIEGGQGIDKILSISNNEAISQIMVNTKSMNKVKKLQRSLEDFVKNYILSSYSIKSLNFSNDRDLIAYANEIKQFVVARGGSYSSKIESVFVNVRKMTSEQLMSIIPKKKLFEMFNSYLQQNYENPIDEKTFLNCTEHKIKNKNLSDYYKYFQQDYLPNFRAYSAYSKLKSLDTKLSDEQILQLAQYVNDDEVAVAGGKRKLKVEITGIPVLTNEVNDMVFNNQKESMILAYVLVFLLFAIQMRSLIIGLLAMVPITLTIITNFGFMGMTGISLNAATVTIASITIGTGIDYTIHYLSRFKKEYISLKDKEKAAIRTSATSGRAIIVNSLAVILGFATFIFSDIGMLKQFGIITAAAMIIAPFLTLTVFPITMSILPDKLLKKFSRSK